MFEIYVYEKIKLIIKIIIIILFSVNIFRCLNNITQWVALNPQQWCSVITKSNWSKCIRFSSRINFVMFYRFSTIWVEKDGRQSLESSWLEWMLALVRNVAIEFFFSLFNKELVYYVYTVSLYYIVQNE